MIETLRVGSCIAEKTIIAPYKKQSSHPYKIKNMTASFYSYAYNVELPEKAGFEFLKTSFEFFAEEHVGNCEEFAHEAMKKYLKKTKRKLPGSVYNINDGSHVFFGAGHEKDPNSVVCDAWAGQVFPFYAINAELGNWLRYLHLDLTWNTVTPFNVITPYNPKVHHIKPLFSYKPAQPVQSETLEIKPKNLSSKP